MISIGEVARASGLSVSALRFYDSAGVLVPAEVDAVTGYRRYSGDQVRAARLIAGLRRVGMPVAEIALAVRDRPADVRRRLDDHRQRLETGLADAKRELLRIHALLDLEENLMTRIALPSSALAAALDAVRFAAGTDPELPMLQCVLFDVTDGALTLVATDRFRMAVAAAPAEVEGPPIRSVVPLTFVDEWRPTLTGGRAVLDLTPDHVRVDGGKLEAKPLDLDYPDHRRLLDGLGAPSTRLTVNTESLRETVAAAPAEPREHEGKAYEAVTLTLDDTRVQVNREFLLEALDACGAGQLVLELDGPIKPLAVRVPGDDSRFSILMPVRV
ncbi:MAG: MerR family transcriptional regulator [Actinomycetota bacterium]|nr:MerR family transcriptional regulator [Actinomycetota bacterium]